VVRREPHDLGDLAIPFYGSGHPRMFEIERRCMDREGQVVAFLDGVLPSGRVLDVGAGDGFTAERLSRPDRVVVALEPESGMVAGRRRLVWALGVVQDIPFHDATFEAAYSTWAFFLSGVPVESLAQGLAEVERVVARGGVIVVVDNAGDDEFSALSNRPLSDDGSWWTARGFERHVLESAFRFDSLEEARELIGFYFGEDAAGRVENTTIGYRIAAYVGRSGEVTR
jgi:SAM-dependent methyltransferase